MQPKQRKTPQRQCAGCGQMFDKRALIRIVRSPEGSVFVDPTGKKPGRGAYLCKNAECLKKAKKTKRLERVLAAAISEEIYAALEKTLSELSQADNTKEPQ